MPLPTACDTPEKKKEKPTNYYCDNYKNKRKLADRLTHRKAVSRTNNSPIRRDTNAKEFLERESKNRKHWSPYAGKLLVKRNL